MYEVLVSLLEQERSSQGKPLYKKYCYAVPGDAFIITMFGEPLDLVARN